MRQSVTAMSIDMLKSPLPEASVPAVTDGRQAGRIMATLVSLPLTTDMPRVFTLPLEKTEKA